MNPIKKFGYYFAQVVLGISMLGPAIFDTIIALGTLGRIQPNNLCPYHAWIGEKLDWFLE